MSIAASEIESYFDRLFPIPRSLTGDGVRESLKIIQEIIPLNIHEVNSGKVVFDWQVPQEWKVRKAYIKVKNGSVICDFKNCNLHLVGYSIPFNGEISYEELLPHLHFIKEMPDAIPYLTSYYSPNWGFCITYNDFILLSKDVTYEVVVDTELFDGQMTYGDLLLKGKTNEEILFTTYICHPSMANNELSGVLVTAFLYKLISQIPNRKYSYRFVFVPETIGTINYLFENGKYLKEYLKAGMVVTCVGDAGHYNFKKSRDKDTLINRIIQNNLEFSGKPYNMYDFSPIGSDERQYCSPGFNFPVAVLSRSIFHKYKEYHTSLDNKDFISFEAMSETIDMYFAIAKSMELNEFYINTNPFCEPQLGKRNLYHSIGGIRNHPKELLRTMNLLNYSDGKYDLIDIANKTSDSVLDYETIINKLLDCGLLVVK